MLPILAMRFTQRRTERPRENMFKGLSTGFSYAFGFPPIRALLLLLALVGFAAMPYNVLLPVFAKDVLHGDANTFGFLVAASGLGALLGAIHLASRKSVRGLARIIVITSLSAGAGLAVFALSRFLVLSFTMMLVVGYATIMLLASINTMLQTIVDEDKRGRVMSFYSMAFLGMFPIGSLLAGSVASSIGTPNTVMLGGIITLIGGAIFAKKLPAIRALIRPIYVRLGIIQEVTAGIDSATQLTEPSG